MSDRPFTPASPDSSVRRHGRGRRENQPRRQFGDPDVIVLYGWHPVVEALRNGKRAFRRLLATENSARRLTEELGEPLPIEPEIVRPDEINRLVEPDAVHQGLYLEADPLPSPTPETLSGNAGRPGPRPDHRSAQRRRHRAHARRPSASRPSSRPPAIARPPPACSPNPPPAASSTCRSWSCATSSDTLVALGKEGFQRIGLDSSGDLPLDEIPLRQPVVLVLGSEGKGLRQRTRDCCDAIGRLDMPGAIKSLNVSNAAAISLFAVTKAVGAEVEADSTADYVSH